MRNRWARWIVAILFWSALGVLFALPGISSPHWHRQLLWYLTFWWAWGLVTPLIFWIDASLPFDEKQLGKRILAHAPLSILLIFIYTYFLNAMSALVGLSGWSSLGARGFLASVFNQGIIGKLLVYCVIFGARQTFRYYKNYLDSELRLERMERNFSEARLNALRMQLDPHFLFNALNTISSQVEGDPRLARTMIAAAIAANTAQVSREKRGEKRRGEESIGKCSCRCSRILICRETRGRRELATTTAGAAAGHGTDRGLGGADHAFVRL